MHSKYLKFQNRLQTKSLLGSLILFSSIFISCGQPMNQKTVSVEPNKGSLTTSDTGFAPAPTPVQYAIAQAVQSTFANACSGKQDIEAIKSDDGKITLYRHSFCIKSASAKYDPSTNTMRFKGTADFAGYRNLNAYSFDVSGSVDKGRGVLKSNSDSKPDGKAPEFKATAFCNELSNAETDLKTASNNTHAKPACGSFFIDLYIKLSGFDNEFFDEQVQDCAKSDKCLSLDDSVDKIAGDKEKDKSKDQDKNKDLDKDKTKNQDKKSDDNTSDKTADSSKDNPVTPISQNPVTPTTAGSPDKIATPTSPAPVIVPADIPADLEINPDDAEQEGADIPDVPHPYLGLNTPNKIPEVAQLFGAKADDSKVFDTMPDETKSPEAPKQDLTKDIPTKTTPTTAKPVQSPAPVPAPAPTTAPKTSTPKSPKEPVSPPVPAKEPVKQEPQENKTVKPDPIDPRIAANEFPFNMTIPTHGPMQVYGGGKSGYLVNATELIEPAAGEAPTFIIDTNTKNLKNRAYRKSFGAFYTVDFLKKLAEFTYPMLGHPIRINDLSLQKGGHLPPHSWHQVGLDVDVEYEYIAQHADTEMTPEQKWIVFQRVGASPLVNALLIDIKDKRAACQIANARGDHDANSILAMKKLKVEAGHPTHFHINFSCTYNEHCNQPEQYLRNDYDKNLAECLNFKMSTQPTHIAKTTAKK